MSSKKKNPKLDVQVTGVGSSVCMVRPISKAAQKWVDENVQPESWQWLGGAFAVEPRMLNNLVQGMRSEGLVVA